jgi:RHS repeat-associated protein
LQSGNSYRYGYNGKEKDTEFANNYDYGFRIYNANIAKFLSVDPLSGKFPYYSPYHFAGNSPIAFLDLDGLEPAGYLWDYIRPFKRHTTYDMIQGAAQRGLWWGDYDPESKQPIPSTRLGRIYEDAVLRSLGEVKKTNTIKVEDLDKTVNPDIVGFTTYAELNSKTKKLDIMLFPSAHLIDAKMKSSIEYDDKNNPLQAFIMIKYLADLKGGYVNGVFDPNIKPSDYGMAQLTFITPENAAIDTKMIEEATANKVLLMHRTTERDANNPGIIRVKPGATILNPGVLKPGTLKLRDNTATLNFYDSGSVEIDWNKK